MEPNSRRHYRKGRLADGEKQHDIAADFGINQGRISEINTGQRFAHVNDNEPRLL